MNVNVDIVSHCKHEKKNDDACVAKVNRSASDSTSMLGMHGKRCYPEVFKTTGKADDCSNVMSDLVDQLALSKNSMTPNMGFQEVKADLDNRSKL